MSNNATKQRFLVSSTEVRVPTLLIGIGGIGGRIVSAVYDQMDVKDRSVVEMLVLDTNINDLEEVSKKGIHCLQTSDNQTVQQYLSANPKFCEWFPTNPLINSKNLIDGAGQIRSVSRLGGLSSEQAGNFDDIETSINNLNKERGDNMKKNLKVMIVGSITGGTGSGLGLQLPYYIRDLLKDRATVLVRGLFLAADITEEKQQTSDSKKAVYVNEYAFVRELNAFYKAQMVPKEEVKVSIEHYNKSFNRSDRPELQTANPVPYDFLFLVEKDSSKNTNLGGMATYEAKAAKIVRSQLFSPISGSQYSAEDNLIIPMVQKNGMNRYCGAGFSSAIYPQSHVERYCTLTFASSSVSEIWLALDRKYRIASQERQAMMKSNPALGPIKLREFYLEEFKKMTDVENMDSNYYFAQFGKEVVRTQGGVQRDIVGIIEEGITQHIKDVYEKAGVNKKKNACVFNRSDYEKYSAATANVRAMLKKIEAYAESAREIVNTASVSCAEEIMPSHVSGKVREDATYSIYDLLAGMHPLSARYVIYQLIERLEQKKQKEGRSNLRIGDIYTKDYHKDDNKQTIYDAINKEQPGVIRSIVNQYILPGANLNTSEYNAVIERFEDAVKNEIIAIETNSRARLTYNVLTAVINKLEKLAELYEEFFVEMEKIVLDCEYELDVLKNKYNGDAKRRIEGDWYVCADEICLESIFGEIKATLTTQDPNELAPDVKQTLFEQLYGEMLKRRTKENDMTADVGKDNSMREIFENGVLAPMQKSVFAKGGICTDIGILGAIKREYKAYRVAAENRFGFEMPAESEDEYLKKVFQKISELATPYISYKAYNGEQLPVAVSYGVNTSVLTEHFGVREDQLLQSQVEDLFQQIGVAKNSPISAKSFSKNELHCYKAVYNLSVENVTRYADKGKAHNAYKERLDNIVSDTYQVGTEEDSYLSVVHPHLDKRWSSRAYLPLLNANSDIREEKFINLAFLLAFALNACRYGKDNNKGACWTYEGADGARAIQTNRDEVISDTSIEALLDGLNYNDIIKRDILERGLALQVYDEKHEVITGTTTATILNHKIIQGMSNISVFGDASKIKTVFDIIYVVYCKTRDDRMYDGLRRSLAGYLADYCYAMANRKLVMGKELLESVVMEIEMKSAYFAEATAKDYEFMSKWKAIFKEERFEENLAYLELADYLIDM